MAQPAALARRPVELVESLAGSTSQFLTFTLGSELFAVPIETVREVVEFHGLTRIPLSPPVVPGVLNLRGAVVPVVDLAERFARKAVEVGRRTCVVVIEIADQEGLTSVGVIVDSVSEAIEVEPSQIEQRPAFGAGLRPDFVQGMLNLDGRFVNVLDMRAVLSMAELEQLVTAALDARPAPEPIVPRERGD